MDPQLKDDLDFIKSFCPSYVPCNVGFDTSKGKHTKVPAVAKWTSVTPDESKLLEALPSYAGFKHFIFVTGNGTNLFAIDIDRKDPSRQDHEDKIDGIEFFEEWCGPVKAADTFTSRSIGGGYHKVYKLTEGLEGSLKSGQLTPLALCDIQYKGRGFMFGEGCEIINRIEPQKPSKSIVQFITVNYNNSFNTTATTNNVNVNVSNSVSALSNALLLSGRVNSVLQKSPELQVLGSRSWKLIENNGSYQLVPDGQQCCVIPEHTHTDGEHSCIYVRKTSVVTNCFSHGKKLLTGEVSKRLRELFFEYYSDKSSISDVIEGILYAASDVLLVREEGYVMRRINDTLAYERVCTYDEFLTYQLKGNSFMQMYPMRYKDLMMFMNKHNDDRFPFVKRDRRYIGFSNGLLDLVGGNLVNYNILLERSSAAGQSVIPRHYIDLTCNFDETDTPLFDELLMYQLESEELYTYMMAFIGRLFYDVKQFDNFDIMPLIVGDSNTGKSTIIDIIRNMFSSDKVGVLDSKHETVFGLQSLYESEVIVASELNEKISAQLSSDIFKKMVCGELVNVAIKYSSATSIQWKIPMFMCGNDYPGYYDDRGSISKRLAIFRFSKYVRNLDDSLQNRIKTGELSKIVVKSLIAYRMLLKHTGTKGFWSTCPDYFRETKSEMNQDTDYIYMFLTLGPDGNAWSNKVMYFVKRKGCEMLLEDFKRKFGYYMRFKHPNVKYKWKKDYSAFKQLGYDVVHTHICKSCLTEAHVNCCDNYSHANRSTRYVIKDIICIEREKDLSDGYDPYSI